MSVQRYTTSQCVWSESRRWLLPFHFILIFCRAELLWLQSTLRFGVIIGVTSLALYSRGMSCKLQNLSKQTCFHETLCWWGKLLWVSDISQSLRKLSKWKRYFCMLIFMNCLALDTLAEWLRRRPAKPMGSPRAGSNPAGVAFPFVNLAPAPNTFPIDWSFPTLEPRHCQLKALLPDINWSLYAGLLFARALLVEGLSWMSVFVRNGCCSPLNQQSCKKHNGKTAGSSFHFIFFLSFLFHPTLNWQDIILYHHIFHHVFSIWHSTGRSAEAHPIPTTFDRRGCTISFHFAAFTVFQGCPEIVEVPLVRICPKRQRYARFDGDWWPALGAAGARSARRSSIQRDSCRCA